MKSNQYECHNFSILGGKGKGGGGMINSYYQIRKLFHFLNSKPKLIWLHTL